jgi:hypothetical protein
MFVLLGSPTTSHDQSISCVIAFCRRTAAARDAGGYHYYGSPAELCCALTPVDLGWAFTRSQPPGDVPAYPALRMADGALACEHSNFRPMRGGWCRRIW